MTHNFSGCFSRVFQHSWKFERTLESCGNTRFFIHIVLPNLHFCFYNMLKTRYKGIKSGLFFFIGLAELAARKYKSAARNFLQASFDNCECPEVGDYCYSVRKKVVFDSK